MLPASVSKKLLSNLGCRLIDPPFISSTPSLSSFPHMFFTLSSSVAILMKNFHLYTKHFCIETSRLLKAHIISQLSQITFLQIQHQFLVYYLKDPSEVLCFLIFMLPSSCNPNCFILTAMTFAFIEGLLKASSDSWMEDLAGTPCSQENAWAWLCLMPF